MKNILCTLLILLCIFVSGCVQNSNSKIGGADGPTEIIISEDGEKAMYMQISQEEAKRIMDSREAHIILDTREKDEYDQGHIPGAILIPHTQIESLAEKTIPDKDMQILVYCRSGRRSKIAAQSLARLGYTNVKEFGGIIDWQYDIVKEGTK